MQTNWPTKEKDLESAKNIIEDYAAMADRALGIFEVVVSDEKEAPDVHVAEWVVALTDYFEEKYGHEQGHFVTKQVISQCILHGKTIH